MQIDYFALFRPFIVAGILLLAIYEPKHPKTERRHPVSPKKKDRKRMPEKYCRETQYYKGIALKLIIYTEAHFAALKAKRFLLGDPRHGQNIWIPNRYLDDSGRILPDADLDWAMQRAYRENKFRYARIAINPYTWQPETSDNPAA